jgi:hypothetical protein
MSNGAVGVSLRHSEAQLAVASPGDAMFEVPIGEGVLETNIPSRLLRLEPLVPEYLVPLSLKLSI